MPLTVFLANILFLEDPALRPPIVFALCSCRSRSGSLGEASCLAMGIQGLTSFVSNHFFNWKRERVEGLLVLDGNNLCFNICKESRISWSQGGQYGEFRAATLRFIDFLLADGIFPVFVFDGIDYKQQKVGTKLDRHTKSICDIRDSLSGTISRYPTDCLSVLTKDVFRDTLKERKIPTFYVDGEGDPDISALANSYGCPVVSNDSDFYIFNITYGYIPMDRLYWKSSPVYADVYYRYTFCQAFRLAPELCFAIPAIVGNDFIANLLNRNDLLKSTIFAGHHEPLNQKSSDSHSIELLIRYLAKYKSLEILLRRIKRLPAGGHGCSRRVESNYRKAGEFYILTNKLSETSLVSTSALKCLDGTRLPLWVYFQYRFGNFGHELMQSLVLCKCLLQVVPDDPCKETAQYCSRPIRQAIYGILERPESNKQSVEELVRKESSIVQESVERVYFVRGVPLPAIWSIKSLSVESRRFILCKVLGCSVNGLEEKWQLVVAASCFWVKKVIPSMKQIQALVLTFVRCSEGSYTGTNYVPLRVPIRKWMESFHCYAQWQCVYKDSVTLNNVLMNPLQYVSPAFLFDGKMVMYYANCRDLNSIFREEVFTSNETLLYRDLYSAISSSAGLTSRHEILPKSYKF